MRLQQIGVGTKETSVAITDTRGSGLLPIQAEVTGTATFRILGRIAPSAPWVEIRAAATAGFLEAISWVPLIQLEITADSGTVTLWVGES